MNKKDLPPHTQFLTLVRSPSKNEGQDSILFWTDFSPVRFCLLMVPYGAFRA